MPPRPRLPLLAACIGGLVISPLRAAPAGSRELEDGVRLLEAGKRPQAARKLFGVLFSSEAKERVLARYYLRSIHYMGSLGEEWGSSAQAPPETEPDLMAAVRDLRDSKDWRGLVLVLSDPAVERRVLRRLGALLRRYPEHRAVVEAYVGDGSREEGERKAQDLAQRVRSSLLREGAAPERTAALGYGEAPERGRLKIVIVEPPARSEPFAVPVHGYLRNETAYRTDRPGRFSKSRNLLYLETAGSFNKNVSYKASGRLFYDALYDLGPRGYPANVEKDQEFEASLRDTYLDVSAGPWDLRLGKQQIVWGESVGLFIADVVNARDLREFLLPDFDYVRIPSWSVNNELTLGDGHLEAVWIPFLQFNKLGVPGSEFEPPLPPVPAGLAASVAPERRPPDALANGEAAGKASYLLGGWDLSAYHLYAWDKSPIYFRTLSPGLAAFRPGYRRLPISGLTFSKEAFEAVWKGEAAYGHGKYFPSLDPARLDGTVRSDYVDYALGVDCSPRKRVDVNLQFLQRAVLRYDGSIFGEERVRSMASVRLKTGFLENRVEPEILFVSNLRRRDMLIRPKVGLGLGGSWRASAGFDFLEGRPDGLFGQFGRRNRGWVEIQWSF